MDVLQRHMKKKQNQNQSVYLWIWDQWLHEVYSPVKLYAHLFDAQAFLVHVTQVKHGLGTVLLLWRQPVVDDRSLVVHICAVAIEVVVPKFYPCHSVTWEWQLHASTFILSRGFGFQQPYSTFLHVNQL